MELADFEPTKKRANFLIQIKELVSEILDLLHQVSDQDRRKTDGMKQKYENLTSRSSDSLLSKGDNGALVATASLLVQFGAMFFAAESDQKLIGALAQQIPQLAGMITSQTDADLNRFNSQLQLLNTEMQNLITKQGNEGSSKETILRILDEVKQWMQKAASHNG
jgi:hypothetical protein